MNKLDFLPCVDHGLWTTEEIQAILGFLEKKYHVFLNKEYFVIRSMTNEERIQVLFELKNEDDSFVYPIEAVYLKEDSIKYSEKDIAEFMLSYIDEYWNEYFNSERDTFLPLDWSKHEFDGVHFYLRGFSRNLSLENKADELFAKYGFGEHVIQPISMIT